MALKKTIFTFAFIIYSQHTLMNDFPEYNKQQKFLQESIPPKNLSQSFPLFTITWAGFLPITKRKSSSIKTEKIKLFQACWPPAKLHALRFMVLTDLEQIACLILLSLVVLQLIVLNSSSNLIKASLICPKMPDKKLLVSSTVYDTLKGQAQLLKSDVTCKRPCKNMQPFFV